ncbi:ADAMTS-like protein 2 [Eublepharis macularius]|uniref:ADAMTS-like protein 2 n=1 Tax=Eublepharis macularius TaxID=481883 RepID=A0AA97JFA4_EUBMA|nr:ADAMTS-like protein 2 [Eublepharis macularius]
MAAPPAFSGRRPLAPPALLLLLACALRAKDSSEAVDGGGTWNEEVTKWWGEWSSWSTCSRTCGGGVMSRERHCLQQRLQVSQGTNSTMCLGQSKHYQLCQQQLCPANAASFKQHQCASFNAKAFGKHYYHWMPLYPDDYTSISNKPCDLQCTTRGGERQLMARAQDGTSCKDRTHQGVCISGKCEPIGCDGSLYSSQTMDRCRVCGGDGSTCYRVSGSFRKGISQLGYVFITNIPAGATDILIIERRKTENILALADESGHFFINGNSAIDNPQNFRVAGTVFKYRRPPNLHSDGLEYIIAQGPTNQSLNAMYYNFNGKMPHITYDYTVPRTLSPTLQTIPPAIKRPLYLHLSESGHNHQEAIPSISQDFNATWISLASDDLGERFPQGEEHGGMAFSRQNFFPSNSTTPGSDWGWKHGEEGESFNFQVERLYHTNGADEAEEVVGGRETDLALRLNQITISTAVPHGAARPDLLETGRIGPSRLRLFKKLCLQDPQNAAFCRELHYLVVRLGRKNSTAGFWNDPLVEWPEGLRKQPANKNFLESTDAAAYAVDEATNDTVMVTSSKPSSKSSLERGFANKPLSELLQSPDTESNDFELNPLGHDDISLADMYRWKVSAYAPCSSTCTSGISTSYALCIRYDGVEVEETYCDALTRPEPTHEFCAGRDCQPRWETSRWSECSRTCSEGYQYRTVRCWKMLAPGFDSSVYDDLCESAGLTRPMERKLCVNKPCGPQWELSEWSECSARCGSPGTMKREVRCSVEPHLCNESLKPVSEKECSGPPCDRHWTASDWGPCSGLCGEGRMNRFIACRNLEGKMISDSQCDPDTKPLAIYPCGDKNCPAHWVEQEWNPCNATCGRGVKTRTVVCAGLEHGVYREYPDKHCDAFPKPEVQAPCFERPCSTWFSTSWSQCSKTCGTGLRVREVKCYQGEVLGQGCDSSSKPEAKQICQLQLCPTDAPDEDCEDKASANCVLVLKVKLCSHWYYRKACCRSCRSKAI